MMCDLETSYTRVAGVTMHYAAMLLVTVLGVFPAVPAVALNRPTNRCVSTRFVLAAVMAFILATASSSRQRMWPVRAFALPTSTCPLKLSSQVHLKSLTLHFFPLTRRICLSVKDYAGCHCVKGRPLSAPRSSSPSQREQRARRSCRQGGFRHICEPNFRR